MDPVLRSRFHAKGVTEPPRACATALRPKRERALASRPGHGMVTAIAWARRRPHRFPCQVVDGRRGRRSRRRARAAGEGAAPGAGAHGGLARGRILDRLARVDRAYTAMSKPPGWQSAPEPRLIGRPGPGHDHEEAHNEGSHHHHHLPAQAKRPAASRPRARPRRLRAGDPGHGNCSAASDGGYSSANAITAGSSESSQPGGGSDYSSVNSITPPASEPSGSGGSQSTGSGYSSVNAISGAPASEPTFVTGSPAGTSDGFDWGSALVGAGAAMALAALGAAALLTVRRRPRGAAAGPDELRHRLPAST